MVSNNTDNTGAKDMSDQCISKAFYTLNQTFTLCKCVFGSEHMSVGPAFGKTEGLLVKQQGGFKQESRPACKTAVV